ncbi:MAG: lipopolysaccharide biosynthesis protein [Gammaproteobacteria bacterium]|nr:lipopolysaccharide biosynthesis protein [Gammaproteobacteria bacterium]NNC57790.1 lipopolysaccharide biosynthesis protein [Woeseiaceae bacterium]NNL51148.1 lipopolysaccharide biosynthesis protein [Woeseiaceae bacterium]
MYDVLKKLSQNSAFYTFANSIEAFSPFLLAIILTRQLTPVEYGVWVLFIALVTFLRPLINLTIQDALRMHFFEMNYAERARFVWSSLCLTTICATAFVAITLIFSAPLSTALSLPSNWLVAIPVAAFLYAVFYFLLAFNQFDHNRRRFLYLHVIQTSASLVFIAFLVFNDWGWHGVVIGKIIGLTVGCVVGAFWLVSDLPFSKILRQPPHILKLARFGLLYLPTGMGLVAIPLTDRLIVTHVLGLAENGLYGVAALFGVAVFVAINGILHAWMPWLFQNLANRRSVRREIVIVSVILFIVFPLGGVVANFIAVPVAPIIIGESFSGAFHMIPWAIAGTVSMGYFFHNQAYLLFKKAVLPMSLSSFSCITLNAVLSYYGAIEYGVLGVLAATIGAFLISASISAAFIFPHYRHETADARAVG